MHKSIVAGLVSAAVAVVSAGAFADVKTVKIADGENWWGAANFFGN